MASLLSWMWPAEPKPMKATDASHDPGVREHFTFMLDHTDPPKTFKPSEVAELLTPAELRRLGYKEWQEALPAIYELAWELREFGDLFILRKGKEVPDDVMYWEIDGPVRIMRRVL